MKVVNPLLVILDLDETLVYGTEQPLARSADLRVGPYFVYLRPHLGSFLSVLRERYSLAVWTSAGRDYAYGVVSSIMPWHAELEFFWCAERCTDHFDHETRNRNTIKKLSKVKAKGYDLERVVMVDDSPEKHVRNYGNLIHVLPFLGDEKDDELPAVLRFIDMLALQPNVRAIEKRGWRLTEGGRATPRQEFP